MPIIRKKLTPADVYPETIRYNPSGDQVEVLIDGVWTPAPDSDPRRQTTLPPRITADPACDGAQSVADALENQIAQILTAIDNGSTAFTIVGIILSIFSFGVFAIFVSIALAIADAMIGYGSAAIETALPPSAFETLRCILYCHMDNQGKVSEGDLENIQTDVGDQIGGLGASIINDMLSLAGIGGINGMSAVGTSTGDCSGCGCATTWCKYWDFSGDSGGWDALALGGGVFGTLVSGEWQGTDAIEAVSSPDLAHHGVVLQRIFPTRTVTHIVVTWNLTKGFIDNVSGSAVRLTNGPIFTGTLLRNVIFSALTNGTNLTVDWSGSVTMEHVEFWLFSSRDSAAPYTYGGLANVTSILMEGEGENPFGVDDCP